jgi:hypothetical protein
MSDTTFTQGIVASHEAWITPDLTNYLTALGSIFEQVWSLVVDQGDPDTSGFEPGYSDLLNVSTCPTQYLPYLAQFNGTIVPPGTPDATARALISGESGMQRGTGPSIVSAAQRYLTGTQSCILQERSNGTTPDPYWFVLTVRPEQVISASQLIAAVNNTKPGGVMWTLVQTDGETWAAATRTWNSDTTTWNQKG